MPTVIRTAQAEDLPAATRLVRRIISSQYRPFWGEHQVNDYIDSGAADEYVRRYLSNMTIMSYKEHTGGVAIWEGNRLVLLVIEPSFPRMGLGTKFLKFCEDKMFAEHDHIVLESYEGYEKANAFYRKHGWIQGAMKEAPEYEGNFLCFSKKRP